MNAAEHDLGAALAEQTGHFVSPHSHDGGHGDKHQIVVASEIQRTDDFVLNLNVPLILRNEGGESRKV